MRWTDIVVEDDPGLVHGVGFPGVLGPRVGVSFPPTLFVKGVKFYYREKTTIKGVIHPKSPLAPEASFLVSVKVNERAEPIIETVTAVRHFFGGVGDSE